MIITFSNHYWFVAGAGDRVYSSAANLYVPIDDDAFKAWQAAGRNPSRIASEAELWDVLAQNAAGSFPDWLFNGTSFSLSAAGVYSKDQLTAYAASKRYDVETGGITVDALPIATDRPSQAMIAGAYSYTQTNPSASIQFKTNSGFIALSADQIKALALAVAGHVQACFAAEATIDAAIAAGTASTVAAVDQAFTGIG